jgi:hypothetical protein
MVHLGMFLLFSNKGSDFEKLNVINLKEGKFYVIF